ncbi:MAG: flagellar biosynthetic protein FliQ [Litoreibacter sp.]|uniref:flagellar biosynthetic protein FliQ n=1 Tax=Litoreibacter sp. TaxID=1969459 RepID=UPI003298D3E4
MLGEAELYDILRQGLWVSIVISGPILAVALGVGLLIGLFQALTSIQEMTLTFVPKVGAILATFWVTMGFMTKSLTSFWADTIIPNVVGG